MTEETIRIEADNADLIELRRMLHEQVAELDLTEDTQVVSGTHGEAVIIGLIVALGGATLTREVFRTIRAWMTHRENMERIRLYREQGDNARPLTLADLEAASQG